MKRFFAFLAVFLLLPWTLAGCQMGNGGTTTVTTEPPTLPTAAATQATQPTTQPGAETGGSLGILTAIWNAFSEDERFSTYGGTVEHAVSDAPGALEMANTQELTTAYLLTEAQLTHVQEGASLVHMMNSNIFTAAVLGLTEGADLDGLSDAWEQNIQQNHWICGQPERLLLLAVDDTHLLMAFGAEDLMTLFQSKVSGVYADARVLFDGAIVV